MRVVCQEPGSGLYVAPAVSGVKVA
jgi:hypothetical protein